MQDFMIRDVFEALIFGTTIIFVAYSPVFRAIGNRIMHGRTPAPGSLPPVMDDPRVDQISGEVAAMRRHLDETLERLDFAERMLAQKEKGMLGGGR